jgi:hypothetical protein
LDEKLEVAHRKIDLNFELYDLLIQNLYEDLNKIKESQNDILNLDVLSKLPKDYKAYFNLKIKVDDILTDTIKNFRNVLDENKFEVERRLLFVSFKELDAIFKFIKNSSGS